MSKAQQINVGFQASIRQLCSDESRAKTKPKTRNGRNGRKLKLPLQSCTFLSGRLTCWLAVWREAAYFVQQTRRGMLRRHCRHGDCAVALRACVFVSFGSGNFRGNWNNSFCAARKKIYLRTGMAPWWIYDERLMGLKLLITSPVSWHCSASEIRLFFSLQPSHVRSRLCFSSSHPQTKPATDGF